MHDKYGGLSTCTVIHGKYGRPFACTVVQVCLHMAHTDKKERNEGVSFGKNKIINNLFFLTKEKKLLLKSIKKLLSLLYFGGKFDILELFN